MKKYVEQSGMRGIAHRAVAAVASLVVLVGCQAGDGGDVSNETEESQLLATIDELMALPSAEDAAPVYEELAHEIREELNAAVGDLVWDVEGPTLTTGSVCNGPYERLEGRSVTVRSSVPGQTLEGAEWLRAVETVRTVAEPHGFVGEITVAAQPDGRQVVLTADRGSFIRIYSSSSFGVTIQSGCLLRDTDRVAVETFGVPDPERWARLFPSSTATPTPR